MKLEINMINVQDGDSIILMLKKGRKKALILIDGGYKKYYPKLKKRLEQVLPNFNNKIDLIICTHYDNDHLGGFEKVIEDYSQIINEIWMHKISETLSDQILKMKSELKEISENNELLDRFKVDLSIDNDSKSIILEGYKDLLRVVEKLKLYGLESKIIEATRGQSLSGFEEFKVISPTLKYYNDYLDELKKEGLKEDIRYNVRENKMLLEENLEENSKTKKMREYLDLIDPCSKLETSSLENSVTATNMVSIVTLLQANNKKYLFTGDAGIETFETQDILDDDLKNIDWLDLPHHGSKNNTSKKMLNHFNPKMVFVSGKGKANRPHYLITNCLKQKRTGDNQYITNSNKNTWYLKFDEEELFERVLD